jgi:membrane protein required for colicin V production
VLRGILLVAIAFFLYNVVMTGQSFTIVDESRSAVVFERMIGKIEERNPEEALGWVTQQYEALIGACEG